MSDDLILDGREYQIQMVTQMKNHEMVDGKLLQTNKKYSQLKQKQKDKIAVWMYEETRNMF